MIRSVPSHLKKQAMRIVSAKIVLAARIDGSHSSRDGGEGLNLREQCLHRLDKLTELPNLRGLRVTSLEAPCRWKWLSESLRNAFLVLFKLPTLSPVYHFFPIPSCLPPFTYCVYPLL